MAEIDLQIDENDAALDMELEEAQTILETDHEKLTNRDAEDSHPEKAITGLVADLEALGRADRDLADSVREQGETLTSQGEAITELEENTMRPMTAEEARNILNG